MASDVHYLIGALVMFGLLGVIAPYLNDEIGSGLNEGNALESVETEDAEDAGISTAWVAIINMLTLPFWTFGLPAMLNLVLLLPIRLILLFIIGRNLWVGGGA